MVEVLDKKIEIKAKRGELLALHSCVKIVLGNEIPEPADAALLMEGMSQLAACDKDTNKDINIKFDQKFVMPFWHCCNIVLENNLQKDHVHATEIITIFAHLALKADELTVMEKPILKLVE